jgi:hypothetical protein
MALQTGLENKKQVYIAAALFAVVLGAGGYEIYTYFIASPSAPPPPAVTAPAALHTPPPARPLPGGGSSSGPAAQKLTAGGFDPNLHLERLARTEQVEYGGSGRNIFSPDSAPAVKIEEPLKTARNNGAVAAVAAVKEAPKAPPIELKYFGYTQTKDKTAVAYFLQGEDLYAAKSGDIVDHRYKIGKILPVSAVVTDLSYNNTQTINVAPN